MDLGKGLWIPTVRTGDGINLSGNLAGMLRNVEGGHRANTGTAGQQVVSDLLILIAEGRGSPNPRDPNRRPVIHDLASVPIPAVLPVPFVPLLWGPRAQPFFTELGRICSNVNKPPLSRCHPPLTWLPA